MSARDDESRSFLSEAEIEDLSRALPEQIARLRAEVQAARARLSKTAREQAREQDSEGDPPK